MTKRVVLSYYEQMRDEPKNRPVAREASIMGMLEKVKLDRVICDEIFYLSEKKRDTLFWTPEGTNVGSDPRITGHATAAVLDCRLKQVGKHVRAEVEFMIQEELTVTPRGHYAKGEPFDLEYAFRFTKEVAFQKCCIPHGVAMNNIKCHVFRLNADTEIRDIRVAPGGCEGVFDNLVKIQLKLKLIEEVQRFVTLGKQPNVTTKVIITPNDKKKC